MNCMVPVLWWQYRPDLCHYFSLCGHAVIMNTTVDVIRKHSVQAFVFVVLVMGCRGLGYKRKT